MFNNFENLPEEKKKRIIDASIEEFAEHGYKKGSTNEIIKKAGISKGILFHYFGSKKNLYLYVLDHILSYFTSLIMEDLKTMTNTKNGDIFSQIKSIGFIKMKIFSQFPIEYKFMADAFMSPPQEIEDEIKKRHHQMYNDSLIMLFNEFDTSNIRKDIDVKKAIELLMIILDGISNKYIKIFKGREKEMLDHVDEIVQDFEEYMHILKIGICK